MNRRFLISIVFLLLIGQGCTKSKSDINGLWVSAYQIDTLQNKSIAGYKKIMRIVGDSIFFISTGEPKNGIRAWNIKSEFKWISDGIEIENEKLNKIYFHKLSHDSIVLSYYSKNRTKEVFKKLKEAKNKVNWNPENKSYNFTGNNGLVNIKFLDNGLYVEYLPEKNDVSVGHWSTIQEKNNLFVVLDGLNNIALSVDSLANDEVFLSIHDEKKFDYILKEQSLEIPNNLLGDWTLVASDTLRNAHFPLQSGSKWPTIDFLSISKDSIQTIKKNVESTKKWTIGGTNNLIILPDETVEKDTLKIDTLSRKERVVLRNIFKIDSLSENELVLLSEYQLAEFDGFEIKLTYHREKTKANKAYKQ